MRDDEGLGWAEIAKKGFDGRRTDNDVRVLLSLLSLSFSFFPLRL
jgi:hypothetical protein